MQKDNPELRGNLLSFFITRAEVAGGGGVLPAPGNLYHHLEDNGAAWASLPDITMADDTYIGLPGPGGRFVFDETPAPDQIILTDANLNLNGNDFLVPDNTADAFKWLDAGGLEYLRIVTTDAQPIVDFNVGGVDVDFNVRAVGAANALHVRGSDGVVGIRTNAPGGTLHIQTTDASMGAISADADDLVVENNHNAGITIVTPDNRSSNLYFASPSDAIGARITWGHDLNNMIISTGKANASLSFYGGTGLGVAYLTIDATRNIFLGTGSTFDLAGNADALIFDAAGNLTLSAPTPGQLDFEIAGADDFTMTANSFNVLPGSVITMADGATIGQAAGPLLTFDDTNNFLEITGAFVGIGTATPASLLTISDSAPVFRIVETDAPADEKNWRFRTVGGLLRFDTRDDADAAGQSWLQVRRTGEAVDSIELLNANVGIGTVAPGSLMEWNFADDDLEFVDAHAASAVGSISGVIEVQRGGATEYIALYDGFTP